MAVLSSALKSYLPNLLSAAAAVGAAAVPFVWGVQPGQPGLGPFLAALGMGGFAAVSGVFSGVLGNALRDYFEKRLSDWQSLLSNGNWHRLVARAATPALRCGNR